MSARILCHNGAFRAEPIQWYHLNLLQLTPVAMVTKIITYCHKSLASVEQGKVTIMLGTANLPRILVQWFKHNISFRRRGLLTRIAFKSHHVNVFTVSVYVVLCNGNKNTVST